MRKCEPRATRVACCQLRVVLLSGQQKGGAVRGCGPGLRVPEGSGAAGLGLQCGGAHETSHVIAETRSERGSSTRVLETKYAAAE